VKQFLTPLINTNNFFEFPTCSSTTIKTITRIYREESSGTILLHELVVPAALALLKPLEDNIKPIKFLAVTSGLDRIPAPLRSRFRIIFLDRETDPLASDFLAKTLKTTPKTSFFYVSLAALLVDGYTINHKKYNVNTFLKKNIKNIGLIGAILTDIRLCGYNIFWEYHFEKLKRGFVWD
jgi:hypothetical protein